MWYVSEVGRATTSLFNKWGTNLVAKLPFCKNEACPVLSLNSSLRDSKDDLYTCMRSYAVFCLLAPVSRPCGLLVVGSMLPICEDGGR
jgi:hypothetical protein